MSSTHADTPDVAAGTDAEHLDDHSAAHHGGDHHPTPAQYVQIAIVLAVLTALEVATYVVEFGALFVPTLLFLMVVKFALVVSWFMHLRFDSRVFRRFLVIGVVLAVSVFFIVLATFREPEGVNSSGEAARIVLAFTQR